MKRTGWVRDAMRRVALCALLGALGAGCASDGGDGPSIAGVQKRITKEAPDDERQVEESDVFKLEGGFLYVHSPTGGLSVIDVSDPDAPALVASAPSLTGQAGELYVHRSTAQVLFPETSASCVPSGSIAVGVPDAFSQLTAVVSPTTTPSIAGSLCFPGRLITSRLEGDRLVLVTTGKVQGATRTWLFSVDLQVPSQPLLVDELELSGEGHEVHVGKDAIYVAQRLTSDPLHGTELRYIDTSDLLDPLVERGSIRLEGEPQGRFHMDEHAGTFRIVTFEGRAIGSNLFVIDIADPDALAVSGVLRNLAQGEQLRATRFEGDRAYLVTFEPVVIENRTFFGDPLWVVSLDPTDLRVLGSLDVPGWSDYVFPRGDRLVAVGRSDFGDRVAMALFDIADPTRPAELSRVEVGGAAQSVSVANSDFRGVRIVEAGVLGATPLLVLPYTDNEMLGGRCVPEHFVQLFDLQPDALRMRGRIQQTGRVLRGVPIGARLYSVSEKVVAAIDVSNRDAPFNAATVVVGDLGAPEACEEVVVEEPIFVTDTVAACRIGDGSGGGPLPALLLLVAALGLRATRRRGA